jgi:hypothetical protein
MTSTHNLNIQSYSFEELLGLFDLKSYDLTVQDMKRAKHKVLMLHPDKSRLSADYFLFYKKAYDVILEFYQNQNRQNQVADEKTIVYQAPGSGQMEKQVKKTIDKTMEKMGGQDFNSKFNELFEKSGVAERPDPRKNEWFGQEGAAVFVPEGHKVSANNLGQTFQQIKERNSGLVRYAGVQEMRMGGGGASLYGDDDDDDGNNGGGGYVNSDPFSKLKFDDLRKVHKDQTVFAVNETDFAKMQRFGSVEEYRQEQNRHSYDPLEKQRAQGILDERDKVYRQQMMRREYEAKLKTEQMEAKNRAALAAFLQLKN